MLSGQRKRSMKNTIITKYQINRTDTSTRVITRHARRPALKRE